ncbi:50S ribosomal protein L25/general stress protein Ctc [uncultured Rikenella sp.]|uniref:50S ribosomal protein L25/general stress protein Ctc n=1 Tax=uncultured Rikenella sp. TaxID=368003 RepID=UPI0026057017|nr:50S ribosomal protein L25/general stress protein Ctc [uncultured Rikenella sp.]
MKTIEIKGASRTEFGKKGTNAVRRAGNVPCVIYGGGDTVHFAVPATEFKQLIYTPHSYIIEFDIDGKKEKAVMREVQFHPVSGDVLHVDFFRVDEKKPVAVDLPVVLTGNSEGVKQGGKLALSKRKLRVSALVKDLPDTVEVDVTELGLGKSIFVGDLNIPGLEILTPATTAICAVRMTRAARGAQAAAAAAK